MTTTVLRPIALQRLGRMSYADAWAEQRRLVAERSAGRAPDTLLLVEHPPTITLGNRASAEDIRASAAELQRCGVSVVRSDRGGDVTYHAPGQIVGYPILKLSQHGADIGRYLRTLEAVIIRTIAAYGLEGRHEPGLTGVWVRNGAAKICAIGVKLSASGVTSHGFALNVNPDLSGFNLIVPCGITDRAVTSLAAECGNAPPLPVVEAELLRRFCEAFDVTITESERVE
jgi:lipoyl(octanoyl) transferase